MKPGPIWLACFALTLGCERGKPRVQPIADDMVLVPAGPFIAGCDPAQRSDCELRGTPFGPVTLPAFEMDRLEVTIGAYLRCVEFGSCESRPNQFRSGLRPHQERHPNGTVSSASDRLDHRLPAYDVTPDEAQTYCAWTGKRLPTQLEWEKAARGTDGRPYPWGHEPPTCDRAVYAIPPSGCNLLDRGTSTQLKYQPVGSNPAGASPYGALDMVGNVDELTECVEGHIPRGVRLRESHCAVSQANISMLEASAREVLVLGAGHTVWGDERSNEHGFRCARDLAGGAKP